jgi:hypothetical protein
MTPVGYAERYEEWLVSGWAGWVPANVSRAVTRVMHRQPIGALAAAEAWASDLAEGDGEPWGDELVCGNDRLQLAWGQFGWKTVGDALQTLRAIGILDRRNRFVPGLLPEDVLHLTREEIEVEAELRWEAAFDDVTRRIELLVEPAGRFRVTGYLVSIELIAQALGVDVLTAREALTLVVRRGGVAVTTEVERCPDDDPFVISTVGSCRSSTMPGQGLSG